MLKIFLAADEVVVRETIKRMIPWEELGFELVGEAADGEMALPLLIRQQPDLLITDIKMPFMDGLTLARLAKKEIPGLKVVILSGYDDFNYAKQAISIGVEDYLLKPISYADFLKSANKALQWYELLREGASTGGSRTAPSQAASPSVESIFIKTEYKLVQVELRKILYIEGLKDYVKIFVEGEAHPILSLMSMKSLEDMLPANRFIRVHRSFIVQPEKIKIIERNRIVFGKEYIPISDNYKQKFMEFLAQRALLP